MIISNSIIYPFVSMSRIEGRQEARGILSDLWEVFLPRIPKGEHSVDACVVTTMGLYGNTDFKPRQKQRLLCAKFNRDFEKVIEDRQSVDERINPAAYDVQEWDVLAHSRRSLALTTQAVGKLRHFYATSQDYKDSINELCEKCGRSVTEENLAFFHEEFAVLYLVSTRQIRQARNDYSLRYNDEGAIFIAYPGSSSKAEILAWKHLHGNQKFKLGQSYYVDTTDKVSPSFADIGWMIGEQNIHTL